MIGSAFATLVQAHLPGWYLLLAESFGLMALIAAYRLIRNQSEGLSLSLIVQATQLVQILLPSLLYRVTVGPYLVVVLSMEETLIAPGFKGEFTIGWKGPESGGIGFNVVALVLFLLLSRAILRQRRTSRTPVKKSQPLS